MSEAECKGKQEIEAHSMVELGRCSHAVGGANYTYVESGCPECGATARRGPVVFACGTRRKAVKPTAANCLALAFKAKWQPSDGT